MAKYREIIDPHGVQHLAKSDEADTIVVFTVLRGKRAQFSSRSQMTTWQSRNSTTWCIVKRKRVMEITPDQ